VVAVEYNDLQVASFPVVGGGRAFVVQGESFWPVLNPLVSQDATKTWLMYLQCLYTLLQHRRGLARSSSLLVLEIVPIVPWAQLESVENGLLLVVPGLTRWGVQVTMFVDLESGSISKIAMCKES
jgi:hypothetical protein